MHPPPRHCSADEVLAVKVLRLDRYDIREISELELMSHICELYLQHVRPLSCWRGCCVSTRHHAALFAISPQNLIARIENLECLHNLRFLALGSNSIRVVRAQ